jgi:hypothetical protein
MHMRLFALLPLCLACSHYDFEPMQPFAFAQSTTHVDAYGRDRKPQLLFLVDRSGSMDEPMNPTLAACQVSGKTCGQNPKCDPLVCPTRWSELQRAMNQLFADHATLGLMGLMVYPRPSSTTCEAPTLGTDGGLLVGLPSGDPSDAELTQTAVDLRSALAQTHPGGGTPTAASLRVLGGYAPLVDVTHRESFVVLLTDGLPNCNDAHPASGDIPGSGCVCTLQSCQSTSGPNPYVRAGCLDDDATVASVKALRLENLRTVVMGFGGDLSSGDAFQVLNEMAEEGGMPRSCAGGALCAADETCDARQLCTRRYYAARSGDELAQALEALTRTVTLEPCAVRLDAPVPDPAFIAVLVDGRPVPGTEWSYLLEPTPRVVLQGETCRRILSADALSAVNIDVRALYPLAGSTN